MIKKKLANGETTFIRITNKDIYQSIQDLRKDITLLTEKNAVEHKKIFGQISLNKWVATTALSLALLMIGLIIKLLHL